MLELRVGSGHPGVGFFQALQFPALKSWLFFFYLAGVSAPAGAQGSSQRPKPHLTCPAPPPLPGRANPGLAVPQHIPGIYSVGLPPQRAADERRGGSCQRSKFPACLHQTFPG